MTCAHEHDAGPYVLGALSAAERKDFERHLGDCPACAQSVRQLAGLPGLLGRVSPDVLDAAPPDPPPDVLPRLLRQVRRERRHRTWTAAAAAAAAVLVVGGGSWALVQAQDDTAPPSQAQGPRLATAESMTRVGDIPMVADLRITTVPWGTRLDLRCSYPQGRDYHHDGAEAPWRMVLVVHTRGGATEEVATWHATSGEDMHLSAATALGKAEISSVEVRTAAGDPVMRLAG
ncbi:MAG TPA: zf-HC2 domain-containing protein [Marmoricola sp.]|jgi:anti-sigma-K factor RskA|nr:zf-HC2 domain-containing protein [Marmoricola sp.]